VALRELTATGSVENGPDQDAEVGLVDAGDGVAAADGCLASKAGPSLSIFFSPAELASSPTSRAAMAASQSIAAVPVPWWINRPKSSRFPTVKSVQHVVNRCPASPTRAGRGGGHGRRVAGPVCGGGCGLAADGRGAARRQGRADGRSLR
jgi:hypothetical protein